MEADGESRDASSSPGDKSLEKLSRVSFGLHFSTIIVKVWNLMIIRTFVVSYLRKTRSQ